MPTKPEFTTQYDRPVEASLYIHFAYGDDPQPATRDDLKRFRLRDTSETYQSVDVMYDRAMERFGLFNPDQYRDITDCEVNPLRYLTELAIFLPETLDDEDTQRYFSQVAAMEFFLRFRTEIMTLLRTLNEHPPAVMDPQLAKAAAALGPLLNNLSPDGSLPPAEAADSSTT
jgi:hypothetical protein